MKTFNQTIIEAIIENNTSYHVYDEKTASEVAENEDGSFRNYDGSECINFDFEGETYYFVKQ